MQTEDLISIAISAVMLAWLLVRQWSVRPLRERPLLPLLLIAGATVQAIVAIGGRALHASDVMWLSVSLAIGIGLAVLRGFTVRLWADDTGVFHQGGWLTATLWIVSVAQHMLADQAVSPGLGPATLMVYFGIVIIAQRRVLLVRARGMGLLAPRVAA